MVTHISFYKLFNISFQIAFYFSLVKMPVSARRFLKTNCNEIMALLIQYVGIT